MENWISVFSTNEEFEAGRIKTMLGEAGIVAEILNHKDSTFPMFQEIDVVVSPEDQERAEKLINEVTAE